MWREQDRGGRAIWEDDEPVRLGNITPEVALDLYLANAEFVRAYARDRRMVAFAERQIAAGEALRRGEKDTSGRAVPLGRMLGLQGFAVSSATALNRDDRNRLILRARAAVPEWADAGPFAAAAAIREAFVRYRDGGGFTADKATAARRDGRAPLSEPRASFFRLAVLDGLPGGFFPEEDTLGRFFRDA